MMVVERTAPTARNGQGKRSRPRTAPRTNAPNVMANIEAADLRESQIRTRHMASNDEVERRGASPAANEGTLSQSSTPSLTQRRRGPRSLEPIVRRPTQLR